MVQAALDVKRFSMAADSEGKLMRLMVIAMALLAAQAARADQVPFPEFDSGPICEKAAQNAPDQPKESTRAVCLQTQNGNRADARVMWDSAPDAARRACQTTAASYAELALCLLNSH
jgi:hypothetical protein